MKASNLFLRKDKFKRQAYHADHKGEYFQVDLMDFAMRSGSPMEVIENLQEMEDEGESYENIDEIWPDYPTKDDFFFNEDEF